MALGPSRSADTNTPRLRQVLRARSGWVCVVSWLSILAGRLECQTVDHYRWLKLIDVLLCSSGGSRQGELCVHVARHRKNVVLLCPRQLILSCGDLHVVGYTGAKTILGQLEFALRKILALLCDLHLLPCGFQIQQGSPNLLLDAATKIRNLVLN